MPQEEVIKNGKRCGYAAPFLVVRMLLLWYNAEK
jgi:hypothetical protein